MDTASDTFAAGPPPKPSGPVPFPMISGPTVNIINQYTYNTGPTFISQNFTSIQSTPSATAATAAAAAPVSSSSSAAASAASSVPVTPGVGTGGGVNTGSPAPMTDVSGAAIRSEPASAASAAAAPLPPYPHWLQVYSSTTRIRPDSKSRLVRYSGDLTTEAKAVIAIAYKALREPNEIKRLRSDVLAPDIRMGSQFIASANTPDRLVLRIATSVRMEDLYVGCYEFPLPLWSFNERSAGGPHMLVGLFFERLHVTWNNELTKYLAIQSLVNRRGVACTVATARQLYDELVQVDWGRWCTPPPRRRVGEDVSQALARSHKKEWDDIPEQMLSEPALPTSLLDDIEYAKQVRFCDVESLARRKLPAQSWVKLEHRTEDSKTVYFQACTPSARSGEPNAWLSIPWGGDTKAHIVAQIVLSPARYSVEATSNYSGQVKRGRLWLISSFNPDEFDVVFMTHSTLQKLYESMLAHVFTAQKPTQVSPFPTIKLVSLKQPLPSDIAAASSSSASASAAASISELETSVLRYDPKIDAPALYFAASWYSWFGSYLEHLYYQHFCRSWANEDIVQFLQNPNWITKITPHHHTASIPILICLAAGMREDDFTSTISRVPWEPSK